MLYVPRHLPNKLEYKVLSCISVHYQSRMTSNEIASTPSRLHSAGRAIWGIVLYISELSWYCTWGYLGMLYAAAWGSKIYTLRGGWMVAGKGVRCMQCLCWGFVLGRRGRLSRRSSIQVDEISCIRDHPRSLLLHTCPHTPTQGDLLVRI